MERSRVRISAVPSGLRKLGNGYDPNVETLGYCRCSLRERKGTRITTITSGEICLWVQEKTTDEKITFGLEGGSSKWVHDTFKEHWSFAWQVKYGAFSVSVSQLDRIIEYIKGQE